MTVERTARDLLEGDREIFDFMPEELTPECQQDVFDIIRMFGKGKVDSCLELNSKIAKYTAKAPGYTTGKGQNESLCNAIYGLTKVATAPYVVAIEGEMNG